MAVFHRYKRFVSRKANVLGLSTDYGNYFGGTTLFKVSRTGQIQDDPFLSSYAAKPVDAVDNFAMAHDIGYDRL